MLAKCIRTILELNWNKRFEENFPSSAHVFEYSWHPSSIPLKSLDSPSSISAQKQTPLSLISSVWICDLIDEVSCELEVKQAPSEQLKVALVCSISKGGIDGVDLNDCFVSKLGSEKIAAIAIATVAITITFIHRGVDVNNNAYFFPHCARGRHFFIRSAHNGNVECFRTKPTSQRFHIIGNYFKLGFRQSHFPWKGHFWLVGFALTDDQWGFWLASTSPAWI